MSESEFTQGHALLVGVGFDLPNTVDDAKGLAEILKDDERCAYPASQVSVLTEAQATKSDIFTALEQLATDVDSDSTAIFFYSGHGYVVNMGISKRFYLMPYGYDADDLDNTAISDQEFMAKLKAIPAQKLLVLLDCCFASGLDNDLNEKMVEKSLNIQFAKAPLPASAATELAKGSGRVVISSCKETEKSYTGLPYSQFTQALVEALTGHELATADGFVRVSDLALYAAKTVPQHTKDRQNPDLHFNKADNFVVAYYAGGDHKPKGLPTKAQRQASPQTGPDAGQSAPTTVFNQSEQTVHGHQLNTAGDLTTEGGMLNLGTVNTGGGGVAGGAGSKASGERGVVADTIEGDVFTGDNARKIQTENYVERQDITVDQGDFVMGSKTVQGDEIHGDKVAGDKLAGDKISIDSISDSSNIAVGRNAQVNVNTHAHSGNVADILQPILSAAQSAPPEDRTQAVEKVNMLQLEVDKGNAAADAAIGGILEDLAKLLPDSASIIRAVFTQPSLKAISGPVTTYVLSRLSTP